MPRASSAPISTQSLLQLRLDLVARQLDDINVLAEAYVIANRDGEQDYARSQQEAMDRYATAMAWNDEAQLAAILAYANNLSTGHDELFAPAFILATVAPDHPETKLVEGRLSEDARAVLGRLIQKQS
jgi:hypothetical protein